MGPCQHKRRWPVGELVERYGGGRMVQDLCGAARGAGRTAACRARLKPVAYARSLGERMRRPAKGAAVRHVGRDGMGIYGHRTLVR